MSLKVTVLKRPSGKWDWTTLQDRLTEKGGLDISQLPRLPEYVLVAGEHTKDEIAGLLEKDDFELSIADSIKDPALPFFPRF